MFFNTINFPCANLRLEVISPAMSTSNKKDIVRGKRYTPEEKGKVVAYVTEYNAKNGRGGQSNACGQVWYFPTNHRFMAQKRGMLALLAKAAKAASKIS